MTPEEANNQIRREISRIARTSERLGFELPQSSRDFLQEALTLACNAGKLETPHDITIMSATFVGTAMSLAQHEGLQQVSRLLIYRAWNERLSLGGNCPPHVCVKISVLDRFNTLRVDYPIISELLLTG